MLASTSQSVSVSVRHQCFCKQSHEQKDESPCYQMVHMCHPCTQVQASRKALGQAAYTKTSMLCFNGYFVPMLHTKMYMYINADAGHNNSNCFSEMKSDMRISDVVDMKEQTVDFTHKDKSGQLEKKVLTYHHVTELT